MTADLLREAREILRHYAREYPHGWVATEALLLMARIDAVLTSAEADRDAAIEECARVCDEQAEGAERNAKEYRDKKAEERRGAYLNCAKAIRALLGTRPAGVVVPVEPTEEMLKAAEREWDGRMSVRSTNLWKAMLAARPKEGK